MKKLEDFLITGIIIEQEGEPSINPDVNANNAGFTGAAAPAAPASKNPTPGNTAEPAPIWNWREHSSEENKAHGREVAAQRRQEAKEKLEKYRTENPQAYREQQEREHNAKEAARQKFEGQDTPESDAARKAAYDAAKELMDQIQNRDAIKKSGGQINPNDVEAAAQKARDANEKVNKLNAEAKKAKASAQTSAQRISPAYWVTHDDFEKATGEKYDPRNARHRQLFFDLNSSGESTVAPTAGVGQGPAYDSVAYHTMRRRPANIPPRYIDVDGKKVANPQARYDTVDGTIANTTPQSRAKAQWDADDAAAKKRIDAEMAQRDAEIKAQAEKTVGGELALDYFKKWADRDTDALNQQKSARQKYIDQIAATLRQDGSRTIVEPGREERGSGIEVEHGQHPIYPERQEDSSYGKPREGPGSAVSDAQNALVNAAGKLVSDKAKDVSDFLKKNLMTFNPYPEQPLEMKIGPTRHTSPTYVVPESEVWSNMSPEEQRAMALAALARNEVHKFFGGREVIIDGKRTLRFSEDNSGQTPEETARLNRHAKMLNKLLDDANAAAEADMAETAKGPKSESGQAIDSAKQLARMYAGRLQGGDATGRRYSKAPTVDLKSEIPAGTQQYLDQFRKNIGQPVVNQEWPGRRKYSPIPFKSKNSLLYSESPNEGNEVGVTVSQGTTKQAQNLDQNTLDSMFIRLYGNEMFRTLPAKQRNLMLMRGRGRR